MLSKRLNAILDLIDNNSIVADIGCDHGKLVCELVKQDKCKKAYAMDVNQKPLNQAIANIESFGYEDNIKTILSNGLEKVEADVDTIVIAGMGFETCKMILENEFSKLKNYKKIIVQVNRDVYKLREWINDNQFTILDEKIIKDVHYYQIVSFNTQKNFELYNNVELKYGVKLNKKDQDYIAYLKHLKLKYIALLNQITDNEKLAILENEIKIIEEIIN